MFVSILGTDFDDAPSCFDDSLTFYVDVYFVFFFFLALTMIPPATRFGALVSLEPSVASFPLLSIIL